MRKIAIACASLCFYFWASLAAGQPAPDPNALFAPVITAYPAHAAQLQAIRDQILAEANANANTVNVPITADLTSVLQTAVAGKTYCLAAGTYTIPGPVLIEAAGIKILGAPLGANNLPATTIVRKSVSGSSSGLFVTGSGVEIGNINFDSDKPLATAGKAKVSVNAIRITGANAHIHNCTAHNVDDFVLLDPPSSAVIADCSSGPELRGDFIYASNTSGLTVTNCQCVGSQNEHDIRLDEAGTNHGPSNVLISGCSLSNPDGKETLAIRMASGPVTVTNCTFNAWVRAGQVSPQGTPPVVRSVVNLTIENCHFCNRAFLQLDQGVINAVITGCIFDGYAHVGPVHIGGPNFSAQLSGNTWQGMAGETLGSAFITKNGLAPTDVVTETATKTLTPH